MSNNSNLPPFNFGAPILRENEDHHAKCWRITSKGVDKTAPPEFLIAELKSFYKSTCRIFNLVGNLKRAESGIFIGPRHILSTHHFSEWNDMVNNTPTEEELENVKDNLELKVSVELDGRNTINSSNCKMVWYNLNEELCLFKLDEEEPDEIYFTPIDGFESTEDTEAIQNKKAILCGYNGEEQKSRMNIWEKDMNQLLPEDRRELSNTLYNTSFNFTANYHPDMKSATDGTFKLVSSQSFYDAMRYIWADAPTWYGYSGSPVRLQGADGKIVGLVVGANLGIIETRIIPFKRSVLEDIQEFIEQ